ncbi:MAG TPA: VWA domain-containing protein [Candidatus Acidoferrales bacterium]|nr:VWA domain-containing protein [Candidatus Acidoferrales bacterium]
MRLTSLAAGILTLAFAAYPALNTIVSDATAASEKSPQGAPRGPMSSPGAPQQGEAPPAPPQEPPTTQQPLEARTTVVNVFVTARDKHNAIVADLTQNDFKVYEDGVEQKVAYFTKEVDMPISLGILMDTSGSMYNILDAEKDAASDFVETVMRKKDEAMIMSFDLDVNLLADFSEDARVLERAIHRAEINAAGPMVTPGTVPQRGSMGTNLYDAVYLACHDELGSEAGRKAVVLLTDAEDNGSKMSEGDAIVAAQKADAVLHFILITDPSASEGYGPGVASKMALETGGRVINVRNSKGLEKAFKEISEELRSQYVLGYYPANTARDGSFRKIKVEVARPDVKILARKGYYAPYR